MSDFGIDADIHYICSNCRRAEAHFEVEYDDAIYSVCERCMKHVTGKPEIRPRHRKEPTAVIIPFPRRSSE